MLYILAFDESPFPSHEVTKMPDGAGIIAREECSRITSEKSPYLPLTGEFGTKGGGVDSNKLWL